MRYKIQGKVIHRGKCRPHFMYKMVGCEQQAVTMQKDDLGGVVDRSVEARVLTGSQKKCIKIQQTKEKTLLHHCVIALLH